MEVPKEELIISEHAFSRFLERQNEWEYNRQMGRISEAIKESVEVEPVPKYLMRYRIINKYKLTQYFHWKSIVFVVRENTVVSVIRYSSEFFQQKR